LARARCIEGEGDAVPSSSAALGKAGTPLIFLLGTKTGPKGGEEEGAVGAWKPSEKDVRQGERAPRTSREETVELKCSAASVPKGTVVGKRAVTRGRWLVDAGIWSRKRESVRDSAAMTLLWRPEVPMETLGGDVRQPSNSDQDSSKDAGRSTLRNFLEPRTQEGNPTLGRSYILLENRHSQGKDL